jgi:hypothetical protein
LRQSCGPERLALVRVRRPKYASRKKSQIIGGVSFSIARKAALLLGKVPMGTEEVRQEKLNGNGIIPIPSATIPLMKTHLDRESLLAI